MSSQKTAISLDFDSVSSLDRIDDWKSHNDSNTLTDILVESNAKLGTRDSLDILKHSAFFIIKLLKKFGEHGALKYKDNIVDVSGWVLNSDDDYINVYLFELPHDGNNPFHYIKVLHPVSNKWLGIAHLFKDKHKLAPKISDIYYCALDFLSKVVIRYYNEKKFEEEAGYMTVIEKEYNRIKRAGGCFKHALEMKHLTCQCEVKVKEPTEKVSVVVLVILFFQIPTYICFLSKQKPVFSTDPVEIKIGHNTFTLPIRLISTTHVMAVDEDMDDVQEQLSAHIASFEYKPPNDPGERRRKKRKTGTTPPSTPKNDSSQNKTTDNRDATPIIGYQPISPPRKITNQ